jgi:spermidine/putrescine transport system ATP-binding protein
MNKGKIEQLGAPEELYELPTTSFVANFLGQSNLFTGDVITSSSSSIVVDVAGRKVEVPRERAQRHSGEVTIGVRPEKLTLHTSEPAAASGINIVGPGRVNDVSFSGVSTQYQIGVPGLGNLVLFAQNIAFGPVVNDGAEVWISWKVEHGFGLADEPGAANRFDPDDDTRELAMIQRKRLEAELEEG